MRRAEINRRKINSASLVIPCYRCASTIEAVLDSAFAQTDPFDEVICYVDASPDNTLEILRRYQARRHPALKVYSSTENKGPTWSRNKLRELASCRYISYQDSDDCLFPQFLEKMRPGLQEGCVTVCGFEQRETDGSVIPHRHDDWDDDTDPVIYFITHFQHLNAAIFDKFSLESIGGLLESVKIYDDKELFIRFCLKGGGVRVVSEVLACWSKRPDSMMHSTLWQDHNEYLLRMAQNLEELIEGQPETTVRIWRRYIEEKMRMAYFSSGCTAYFPELSKYRTLPSGQPDRLISQTLGYKNYLRLIKAYSRLIARRGLQQRCASDS